MSHQHYITEGFVLGHLDIKESSKLLYVFTEKFGLVLAYAQGVREVRSKMRANLQDFTCLRLGLVRGREFWRVTSAEENSLISNLISSPKIYPKVSRIFSLIRRLVQGEVADSGLYCILKEGLAGGGKLDERSELNLVAKILLHLGYLKAESLKLEDHELLQAVNYSLASSQL